MNKKLTYITIEEIEEQKRLAKEWGLKGYRPPEGFISPRERLRILGNSLGSKAMAGHAAAIE